jgi:hypothetical protein
MKTEYRVVRVDRYVVTRHQENTTTAEHMVGASSSSQVGEFANGKMANDVADAMVVKDLKSGIESYRACHGMSLGEVISGGWAE